jgi:hypothetical protein
MEEFRLETPLGICGRTRDYSIRLPYVGNNEEKRDILLFAILSNRTLQEGKKIISISRFHILQSLFGFLVVRVPCHKPRGPRFDSQRSQIF